MPVDDEQNVIHHLLTDHAAGHLGDGPEGHVVGEQDVKVRLALGICLFLHACHDLVHQSCHTGFGIIELADGIVGCQRAVPVTVGNRSAKQRLKFRIGHGGNFAAFVAGKIIIGQGRFLTGHMDAGNEPHIGHVGGDTNFIFGSFNLPAVGFDVEVAESLVVQRNGDSLALPRFQEHLGKALQLLLRAEHLSVFAGNINLCHLRAVPAASVGDGKGNAVLIRVNVGVSKGRITQTIAEGIAHRQTGGIKIAVANVQTLSIFRSPFQAGEVGGGSRVGQGQGPSLIQLTGGVNVAQNGLRHGPGSRLAA